jgi:hypothetical protein
LKLSIYGTYRPEDGTRMEENEEYLEDKHSAREIQKDEDEIV